MSLNATNLSVLAYANSFTLWHYTTADASITGAGYFNQATDMLRVNDLIMASVDTGKQASIRFYGVVKNKDGIVTILDLQAGNPSSGAAIEHAAEPKFHWEDARWGMAFYCRPPACPNDMDIHFYIGRRADQSRCPVMQHKGMFTAHIFETAYVRAPEHDITLPEAA